MSTVPLHSVKVVHVHGTVVVEVRPSLASLVFTRLVAAGLISLVMMFTQAATGHQAGWAHTQPGHRDTGGSYTLLIYYTVHIYYLHNTHPVYFCYT